MAVPIKAEITNTPAARKWTGTTLSPRFTVESTPPMALATVEKAPARMKMMSMVKTFSLAAPLAKTANFSSMLPLPMQKASSTAMNMAVTEGNW